MKTAKRLCVFMLTIVMLFFTGCWDYYEVDNMAMVSGFAIDKGEHGHKYHLTFEFLDLTADIPKSKLLETDGDTVFEGIRNAIAKSEKKLFFSHTKVMIISKDLAAEGLTQVIDLTTHDTEPRLTLTPLISIEKTAGEILRQKAVADQLIGLELSRSLDQNSAYLSESPNVPIYEVYNMLAQDGISVILPTVKISKSKSGSCAELDGTAIFKRNKLVGFLSKDETKYLLFIKDKIKGGLLLSSANEGEPKLCFEISGSKTKITPVISGNDLTMKIEVQTKAIVGENLSSENYTSVEGIEKAQKHVEATLENGISNLIKNVQSQYDSDIFGFGNIVFENAPKFWKTAKPNWDETFRTLKFTISAKVHIKNTAMAKTELIVGD